MALILPYIGIFALLGTQSDARYPPPNGRYFKELPGSATVAATFIDQPSLPYSVTLKVTCTQMPLGVMSKPIDLDSNNNVYTVSKSGNNEYIYEVFMAIAALECPNLLIDEDLERFIYHDKEDTVEAKVKGKFVTLVKSPA
ncbi:hypothetical protein Pmar_PMAR029691 [Perkinsus marinus ATCC 50983]|uniref:Uncharacterized protein n=1 Tax=Perkinsus marinus (strain ATCC 50983 / TXsc) TaxID=423536 RepID=C5KQH8_PERM5|nr:hypothetical protein Pmar_PMAR029691 [Perkinsus marinus ATCC 50983]EER13254.1 hypothetical protein Pmar_PMAR029691 [Perkinsus marinus ATCC 50983]|eukprot:XP_002781459.1 hypothetical protein Pmar_PMAR029691 [Perkinsus marinus ATCC 50983]